MLPSVALLLWLCTFSFGLERNDLYPYGEDVGDRVLPTGDENKLPVRFPRGFVYFRRSYRTVYVRKNEQHIIIIMVKTCALCFSGGCKWNLQFKQSI